jgi:protein gp37
MNAIGWCDETLNPMTGCTKVSEGCLNCYAERMARRFEKPKCPNPVCGDECGPDCYFRPTFHPERLDKPLHWRKPRRIFVCSMSDLFHEAFTWDQRWDVLDVVESCPQHTFIVLTKRAQAMHDFFAANEDRQGWPPANLWLGVTVENQARADERIPILLDTPAAVRFVCCEPLLSGVDLSDYMHDSVCNPVRRESGLCICSEPRERHVDWVIVGGENGPGARPMQLEWALDLVDQVHRANVPVWFKGWGSASTPPPFKPYTQLVAIRELPAVAS